MKLRRAITTLRCCSTLYPTTFRWNQTAKSLLWRGLRYFISHYVQMKLCVDNTIYADWISLYPTTFRWNWALMNEFHTRAYLYIPLRSDETTRRTKKTSRGRTLYPTTFRWNAVSPRSLCAGLDSLYIPLRSDETLLAQFHKFHKYASLYPTTFRWNDRQLGRSFGQLIPNFESPLLR